MGMDSLGELGCRNAIAVAAMEMDATTATEQYAGQQQKPVNKQLDNGFVWDGSGQRQGQNVARWRRQIRLI
jgi:hypothetical protein